MCCLIFNFSLTKCFAFARFHENVTGHISSQQKKRNKKTRKEWDHVCIAETRARQVCGAWVLVYRGYLGLHSVGFRSLFIRGKSWRRFPVPNSHSWRYIHCNVYKLFMISRSQINRRPFTPRHYNNKDRMQHVTELCILIFKTFWKKLTPNININHRRLTCYIFIMI